jgi:hypothetical protein
MYRQPPAPAPKPPTRPLRIVAIVAAVVVGVLVVGGFIVVSAIDTKSALQELATSEGGPPMTEEEVLAALSGPKKDFVGRWSTVTGDGVLHIQADGRVGYSMKRGLARENANARISSFTDDAFYVMTFRFPIESPPRRVGGKWVMKVRGHTWERD